MVVRERDRDPPGTGASRSARPRARARRARGGRAGSRAHAPRARRRGRRARGGGASRSPRRRWRRRPRGSSGPSRPPRGRRAGAAGLLVAELGLGILAQQGERGTDLRARCRSSAPLEHRGAPVTVRQQVSELHRREHRRRGELVAGELTHVGGVRAHGQTPLGRPPGERLEQLSRRCRRRSPRAPAGRDGASTRPVPAPRSSAGPPPSRDEPLPEVEVGRVAAALGVVPDDRIADPALRSWRSLDAALTASTPWRARGGRAACAARSGRCRWAARRAGSRRRSSARSSESAIPATTSIRSTGQPAYLSRSAISAARVPAQVIVPGALGQQLEVGVPDPGDVAAVGDPVVEREPEVERPAGALGLLRERAQDLVRPRRVLDQQDRERALADRDRLDPAEDRLDARERVGDPLEGDAEAARRRRSRRARCRRCRGRAAAARPRARRPACGTTKREPSMPSSSISVAA